MDNRRVVVTGVGAVSPLGLDVEQTWQPLIAGRSGVRTITAFDAKDSPVRIAAEVHGFDAVAVFGRRRARHLDRVVQLALVATKEAIEALQARRGRGPRAHRRGLRLGHRRHPHARGRHPVADRPGRGMGQPVRRADDDPQHGGRRDRHGVAAARLQLLHGDRLLGVGPRHRHGLRRHPPGPGRRHGVRAAARRPSPRSASPASRP